MSERALVLSTLRETRLLPPDVATVPLAEGSNSVGALLLLRTAGLSLSGVERLRVPKVVILR